MTFSLLFCFLFGVISFSQSVITIYHSSGELFAYTFEDAVKKAPSGSIIYLPGGSFATNEVNISKTLTIIGAGHFADSSSATGITQLTGNIILLKGADNCSLQGFYLTGDIKVGTSNTNDSINNLMVKRCNVNLVQLGADNIKPVSTNATFEENIIRSTFHGAQSINCIARKCFFNGVADQCVGTVFRNNVFFGTWYTSTNFPFSNACSLLIVENNIFYNTSVNTLAASGQYFNNLSINSSSKLNTSGANNLITSADSIFVNPSSGAFSYGKDFHLKSYCKGKNAGTDNTDLGVYGSSEPFKDGGLPVNPHIYFKDIAPATNPNGTLTIKFGVRVQTR